MSTILAGTILPLLSENPNVPFVVSSLEKSGCLVDSPATELAILASKTVNYLNGKTVYSKWAGNCICIAICRNPQVISSHGNALFLALSKNVAANDAMLLKSTLQAITSMVLNIKGKPSLTREIVTPNLPKLIGQILKKDMDLDIVNCMSVLIQTHPTIFRSHATAFETKLVQYLTEGYFFWDEKTKKEVMKSYVLLTMVSRTPGIQWLVSFNSLMNEFKSVLSLIFSNIVKCDDTKYDPTSCLEKITKKIEVADPKVTKSYLQFPSLDIDLNISGSAVQISQRVELLTSLLIGFVTTAVPFKVNFPMGRLILLTDLLSQVSPSKHSFFNDLFTGDANLKAALEYCCFRVQIQASNIVNCVLKVFGQHCLTKYESLIQNGVANIVPTKVLSTNVKGRKTYKTVLDKEKVQKFHQEILIVISLGATVLKTAHGVDSPWVLQLVDMAFVLLSKQIYAIESKGKFKKNSTELSDFIADKSLLEIAVDAHTKSVVIEFFQTVLTFVDSLSFSQFSSIEKYAIFEAIFDIKNGGLSKDVKKLVEYAVIYTNKNEKYSILPIVMNILQICGENSERLSLLMNPRIAIFRGKEEEDASKEEAEVEDIDERVNVEIERLRKEMEKEIDKKVEEKLEVAKKIIETEVRKEKRREMEKEMETEEVEEEEIGNEEKKHKKRKLGEPESEKFGYTSLLVDEKKEEQEIGQKGEHKEEHKNEMKEKKRENKEEQKSDNDYDSDFLEMPDIEIDSTDEEE